jgi:hypothetical protein
MKKGLLFGLFAALLAIVCFTTMGDVGAASLSSRVQVSVSGTLSDVLALVTAQAPLSQKATIDLANGTGAGQADVIWSDQRTLTTGASEDLDFAGGALTDAFGAAVAPARIKVVYLYAASGNTTNLTIAGDANGVPLFDDPTDTVTLKPSGVLLLADPGGTGYVVTADTGDILQVTNGAGASATYDIVIIGASS